MSFEVQLTPSAESDLERLSAIAHRRVQMAFHARAQAASDEYHRTGIASPAVAVLDRLQAKLDAKRKKLAR